MTELPIKRNPRTGMTKLLVSIPYHQRQGLHQISELTKLSQQQLIRSAIQTLINSYDTPILEPPAPAPTPRRRGKPAPVPQEAAPVARDEAPDAPPAVVAFPAPEAAPAKRNRSRRAAKNGGGK